MNRPSRPDAALSATRGRTLERFVNRAERPPGKQAGFRWKPSPDWSRAKAHLAIVLADHLPA